MLTFNFINMYLVRKYDSYTFIRMLGGWKIISIIVQTARQWNHRAPIGRSNFLRDYWHRVASSVFQLALFRTYAKRDFASISERLANAATNQIADESKMAYGPTWNRSRPSLSLSPFLMLLLYACTFYHSINISSERRTGRVLLKYASCPSCFYWQIKRVSFPPPGSILQATMDPYCLQDRISRIVFVRCRMLACRRLCVIFRFNLNAIKFQLVSGSTYFLDVISSHAIKFRRDFQVDSNKFI